MCNFLSEGGSSPQARQKEFPLLKALHAKKTPSVIKDDGEVYVLSSTPHTVKTP